MQWEEFVNQERKLEYFKKLAQKINIDRQTKKVFPPKDQIFTAFKLCPLEDIKVVIVGQDPYHEYGQAHGLAFSVQNGVKMPPSLQNIYKEISNEFGYKMSTNGDLSNWAKQGVFLLNSSLTVNEGRAGSHKEYGWQIFTKKVIQHINQNCNGIVFLLWGRHAIEVGKDIDKSKNYVLTSAHPSPLSAYNGFFGNNHFIKANQILEGLGKEPIDWRN